MPKSIISALKAAAQLAFLGVVALTLYSCTVRPADRGHASLEGIKGPPVVRVALSKYFPAESNSAVIAVEGEYRVTGTRSGTEYAHGSALTASMAMPNPRGGVLIGRQAFPERDLKVVPAFDGSLKVGDRYYRGTLRIVVSDENRLLLVNEVPMESYIAGVIGAEMPLEYPRAALEAQAVAARTYALYEIHQAELDGRGELWHVLDDTRSQVYSGTLRDTEKARDVAAATKGVALLSGGRLFCSYFHSTCGGHTEAADLFFPVPRMATLAGRPCEYCGASRWSHWEVQIPKADLCTRLGVKDVSGLRIAEKTSGIHALKIEAGGRTWNGMEFRLSVGPDRLPSTAFEIEDRGPVYLFRGRGYGHGIGLCQMGARGMAELGYDSTEILRYYYPGAEVIRVY